MVFLPPLAYNISANDLAATFRGFGNAGDVEVKRQAVGNGHVWTLIFLTRLGALPAVAVNADSLICSAGAAGLVALETHQALCPLWTAANMAAMSCKWG